MARFSNRTVALAMAVSIGSTYNAYADLDAFPGALGFGANATGGRTGGVYVVTNLNDSGAGSFRDAVSHSNRIIVFAVAGAIHITTPVTAQSNLTILGQTAPGDGISVYGAEVSFYGRSNEIVQYIRFRDTTLDPGGQGTGNSSGNCVNLGNGNNMVFDHTSLEFASYNNVDSAGTNGTTNITFSNSIIADPITAQQFNFHAEGANYTYINNIFANSHNRSVLAKADTQYVNNSIYNYQAAFTTGNSAGKFNFDILNNYFVAGPSTTSSGNDFYQVDNNQSAYATGNLLDGNKDGILNGSADNSVDGANVLAAPWSPSTLKLPILSTAASWSHNVAQSGDSLRHDYTTYADSIGLDQVDTTVLNDVKSNGTSGKLYSSETGTGLPNGGLGTINSGFLPTSTPNDGIPDIWAKSHGLTATSIADATKLNALGYTMIEQFAYEISDLNTVQTWTSPSGRWTQGGWSIGTPGIYDDVLIRGNGSTNGAVSIIGSDAATAFRISIGGNGPAGGGAGESISISSTTLTVQDTILVGDQNNATFTISGGVTTATNVQLGNTVWSADGSASTTYTGTLNLNGGILSVQQLVRGGGAPGNWNSGSVFNWNGGTLQSLAAMTVKVPATLGASGGTMDTNGFNATYAGALSGTGVLTKIGTGVLTLTASNTHGGTTIQAGEVSVASQANLGGSASTVNFTGGLLQVTGTAITNLDSHTVNWSTFNGGFDIATAANAFTVSESIGGTGSVTAAGVGTLTLSGTNSYTGGTNLLGGTLVVSADANLGAAGSSLNFSGGTLRIIGTTLTNTNNHPLASFGSGTIDINDPASTFTIAQQVNASGDITKVGPGTLVFGTRDYAAGNLFLNAGTIRINDGLGLRYMTVNLFTPGTTLDFNGLNPTIGAIVGNQTLSLQSISAYVENNNSSTTFSGVITSNSAAGGLVKIGYGTLTLTGANTYTCPTTINSGVLTGSAFTDGGVPGPLGASSNAAANLVLNGGTLLGSGSTDRAFTLTANSTLDNSNGFNIGSSAGVVATPAGSNFVLTLTGTSTGHNTLSLQMPDPAGGTLFVLKTGTGKWTFSGGAKTYSGDTNVTAGTLETLSGNNCSPNSNVIIGSGASLELHANSQTINALSGAGAVYDTFGSGQTLTIGAANGSGTFSGIINGPITLIKNGTGTQVLTGANTYTNPTNVNGGVLTIGATGSLVGTAYSVGAAGTFSLLSGATIPANASITSNGTINFFASRTIATLNGTSTAAVINLNAANLTVSSGGIYAGGLLDNGSNGALTVSSPLSVGNTIVTTLNVNADLQITGNSKASNFNLLGTTGAWTTGLDLTGNKFILEAAAATKATVFARLKNQVAFGAGTIDGIFNSTALPTNYAIAVMDNGSLTVPFTSFGGIPVDPNSILVSPELLGDANADGAVDLSDLSTILNHFGQTTPNWTDGNFDGAATINLTDLSYVLNNFGLSNANANAAPAPAPAFAAAPAPEPATLATAAVSAVLLIARRRPLLVLSDVRIAID